MSERNTVIRSLHDLGLAAWFGGSLMGATGLNGAASEAANPQERLKLSSVGWAKWTPWQLAAVVTHGIGGIGLIAANRSRLRKQQGATSATVAKLVLTVAAAGTTAYSGVLGTQVKKHEAEGAEGATQPSPTSSRELGGRTEAAEDHAVGHPGAHRSSPGARRGPGRAAARPGRSAGLQRPGRRSGHCPEAHLGRLTPH